MEISSDRPNTKEFAASVLVPMEALADIERNATLEVSPKKVVILKGKLIEVPRRSPELGLSKADLAGLGGEGNDD